MMQRYPQRAKVLGLDPQKMMKQNAQAAAENQSTALIEYMRSQEKSQQEVINAWDGFLAKCVETVVETSGCTPEDIELRFAPVNTETWEQEVILAVGEEEVLRINRTREDLEWAFICQVIGEEDEADNDDGRGVQSQEDAASEGAESSVNDGRAGLHEVQEQAGDSDNGLAGHRDNAGEQEEPQG